MEDVGEPAPRAPQRQEPRQGLQTPPAPEHQSDEEGPKDTATLVVDPLPWDDEELPGRVLKKTPPPTTAVRVEPQQKKTRFEEESAKRPRRGEPARDSGGASSSGRDGYMVLVERRIVRSKWEKMRCTWMKSLTWRPNSPSSVRGLSKLRGRWPEASPNRNLPTASARDPARVMLRKP